jgi:hypothetical protein
MRVKEKSLVSAAVRWMLTPLLVLVYELQLVEEYLGNSSTKRKRHSEFRLPQLTSSSRELL